MFANSPSTKSAESAKSPKSPKPASSPKGSLADRPPIPRLDRLPSLSGDPFDAFDDFADFARCARLMDSSTVSTTAFSPTADVTSYDISSPVTPACSTTLAPASSSTTASSSDITTPRAALTPTPAPAPAPAHPVQPLQALEQLRIQVQTLRAITSARRTSRAIRHLHQLCPSIAMTTILSEDVIPAVCDALSGHVSSSEVCEQACRFLSGVALRSTRARRAALQHAALQLANDAISMHFLLYPTTIQEALRAIGALCTRGTSLVTHTLLTNRIFHWIVVSMRQWRDVPLIQMYAFRALSICARMDFEVAFHLVLSHALFEEIVTTLANFPHDPFLVADAFDTVLSIVTPSRELRRLALCDGVFTAIVEAAKRHCDERRVAVMFARVVVAFCQDVGTRVEVVRKGGVHALLEAMVHVRVSDGRPVGNSLPVDFEDVRFVVCDDENGGEADTVVGVHGVVLGANSAEVHVAVLQALRAVCTGCEAARSQVLHRRCVNVIAKATTLHADDAVVMEQTLMLFCTLVDAGEADDGSVNAGGVRPVRSGVMDAVIRVCGLALYGHLAQREPVRLAVALLVGACQRGYRRLIVKRVPKIVCAAEKILQIHEDESIVRRAATLLEKVRC